MAQGLMSPFLSSPKKSMYVSLLSFMCNLGFLMPAKGRFYMGWLNDEQYQKKAFQNMASNVAKEVQALVWGEITVENRRITRNGNAVG
ncbi:hypothetical protein F4821DRAFT_256747 [Hypoxylon rubiginosum]|uniref:Uncharacterized protein n=1 Tax=Hypoxylon rubiginosum TaxID=110542 RepID=A0ACC0DAU8_9PEZI|nr:hypothetical protein F4821DRAFT_256747 [Hypoxylon rubiginosum]